MSAPKAGPIVRAVMLTWTHANCDANAYSVAQCIKLNDDDTDTIADAMDCARMADEAVKIPARTWQHVTLDACEDCLMWTAYGETSGDRVNLGSDIHVRWPRPQWRIVCGDDGEAGNQGFSWSACECCGSSLAGIRHQLIAMRQRMTLPEVE